MAATELIDQLLDELEEDRRRIERREVGLRTLRESLTGTARPVDAHGEEGTVVVVAARVAYGFYLRNGAYVCQPNRAFNRPNLTHMAFYSDGAIQREIPEIVDWRQDVEWTLTNAGALRETGNALDLRLADLIETSLRTRDQDLREGQRHDVFLLTGVEEGPVLLDQPVAHRTWKHNGAAYTRKQRYVPFQALKISPHDTDELEAAQHELKLRRRLAS